MSRPDGGAGGHRGARMDRDEAAAAAAQAERERHGERARHDDARSGGPRDMAPAVGKAGGPASWKRAVTGAAVALHRRRWQDGRWSYLYQRGSDYVSEEPADADAVAAANRRMRNGPPPEVVQGPMMHAPVWTWEVPLYFWFGGMAAGASFVALACDLGADEDSARVARKVALVALLPSPPLLIGDLGRPERFYNMLRVFKPRSPMSMGSWALSAFGGLLSAAIGCDLLGRRREAKALGGATAVVGGYLGSYTGVLLASTAVPLWNRSKYYLGPIFVSTATLTGAAATRLVLNAMNLPKSEGSREALGRVEGGAMAAELLLTEINRARLGRLADALEEGAGGRWYRRAQWLARAGLALRLARGRAGGRAEDAASVAFMGAALCFRFAWMRGGFQSARDDEAVARNHRGAATRGEPSFDLKVVQNR